MIKKALSIMICTLILLMRVPFKSLAADTITNSNIKGVNVSVVDYKVTGENTFNQNYPKSSFILKFELVFDKEYLGYVTGKFTCSIFGYDSQGTSLQINVDSGSKSFYVCGQTLTYYVEQTLYYPNTPTNTFTNIYTPAFTLSGSNVRSIDWFLTLASIESDVYDIFNDISDIKTYLYDEDAGTILEQVVQMQDILADALTLINIIKGQLDDVNMNLEIIQRLRQYDVPIYSWNIVWGSINRFDEFIWNAKYSYYTYPSFLIPRNFGNNLVITSAYFSTGDKGYLVYGASGNLNTLQSFILDASTNDALQITNRKILYNENIPNYGEFRLFKIEFTVTSPTQVWFRTDTRSQDLIFVPILFINTLNNTPFDSDFAQMYDLIDKTAQENLDDNTDQMQNEFNDLFTIEDDYGDQLNNQLNNIDFSNPLQNNTSMLSSGNFVIQVFNGLIANNPLSILIIIVCIFFVARRLFG